MYMDLDKEIKKRNWLSEWITYNDLMIPFKDFSIHIEVDINSHEYHLFIFDDKIHNKTYKRLYYLIKYIDKFIENKKVIN